MLSFELPVNILELFVLASASMLLGFLARRKEMHKLRAKLFKAESEILRSHAEILELQQETITIEQAIRAVSKKSRKTADALVLKALKPLKGKKESEAGEKAQDHNPLHIMEGIAG